MLPAPELPDEALRIESLRALHILDSPREERFDRITRLASRLFHAPVSTIGFIDSNRLWFKSTQGMYMREAARDTSFCGHAITSSDPLIVSDAKRDERFADNPTVAGEPFLRFYAGQALNSPDQRRIGTLCVVDYRPRTITEADVQLLKDMAAWVEHLLRLPGTRHVRLERVLSRDKMDDHPRIDRVTRAWNRNAIAEIIRREHAAARHEHSSIGIILITIDNLSDIEARYGPVRRDLVIAETAMKVRTALRPHDIIGRPANDQLSVVLIGSDLPRTAIIAERMREAVASHHPETSAGVIPVTISTGVVSSSANPDADPRELLAAATEALEKAMRNGGNRTVLGSLD